MPVGKGYKNTKLKKGKKVKSAMGGKFIKMKTKARFKATNKVGMR